MNDTLSSAMKIDMASRRLEYAVQDLQELMWNNCPGRHAFKNHRDGKPKWCEVCGYTENGILAKDVKSSLQKAQEAHSQKLPYVEPHLRGRGPQDDEIGKYQAARSVLTLDALVDIIGAWAESCGWWAEGYAGQSVGEKFMLIDSEIAEAYEEFRNGRGLTEIYFNDDKPLKPEGIPIELADAIIRILDFCGHHAIDIAGAITHKMDYNVTRKFRHGGKLA